MSKDIVISIENLSKEYRLGVISHRVLYRDMQSWWSRIRGKEDPNSLLGAGHSGNIGDRFLALNDVNLQIASGDIVGIIGKNGAGKSTLLKILSKVTAPTKGEVKIKGKILSLLEVGTGFHPELTGRENIFLNAAILGMNKSEVVKKFEEIVDFSGVEKFIDTPVKRYSSGMYVRLAFAVAAHLEPDILIVDEVLAVGDIEFQNKCLGKMEDVSKNQGRTVLFVSHNMEVMERLCKTGVLMSKGKLIQHGPIKDVISQYVSSEFNYSGKKEWNLSNAPGNDIVKLLSVSLLKERKEICSSFYVTDDFYVEVEFTVLKEDQRLDVHVYFHNETNIPLFLATDLQDTSSPERYKQTGNYRTTCKIPKNLLTSGVYGITVGICSSPYTTHLVMSEVIAVKVLDNFESIGARGNVTQEWPRVSFRPVFDWFFEFKK